MSAYRAVEVYDRQADTPRCGRRRVASTLPGRDHGPAATRRACRTTRPGPVLRGRAPARRAARRAIGARIRAGRRRGPNARRRAPAAATFHRPPPGTRGARRPRRNPTKSRPRAPTRRDTPCGRTSIETDRSGTPSPRTGAGSDRTGQPEPLQVLCGQSGPNQRLCAGFSTRIRTIANFWPFDRYARARIADGRPAGRTISAPGEDRARADGISRRTVPHLSESRAERLFAKLHPPDPTAWYPSTFRTVRRYKTSPRGGFPDGYATFRCTVARMCVMR